MKIVPAATHAGWHVPLKISKKSIQPDHCCVLRAVFPLRAITGSIYVTNAAYAPIIALRMPFILKMAPFS
jgi:hypothetical protein